MTSLALKMLIGHKASFFGVVFGIFLATLLISQQSAIFLGVVSRSYRFVTDIPAPNIWVMDPATESEDKLRMMPGGYLDMVRSTPGVEWAVPLNTIRVPVVTPSGTFEVSQLYGIDDATLLGAPAKMIHGSIRDLRRDGGVIVDVYSANRSLAHVNPNGSTRPLGIGDALEINGHHAVVVGICEITQGFYPQPIIFTSFSNSQAFYPSDGSMAYILAKSRSNMTPERVCAAINTHAELQALTRNQMEDRIIDFFLKTGILINFALSVALGIIIGFSIAGQIFYVMTLQNLMYYALIKAIGGTKNMILKMIIFQAAIVGFIGFSLGIGATVLWGYAIKNTTLAFLFPWQLLLFTGFIVLLICIFTAALSIQKVFKVDPKVLMGT